MKQKSTTFRNKSKQRECTRIMWFLQYTSGNSQRTHAIHTQTHQKPFRYVIVVPFGYDSLYIFPITGAHTQTHSPQNKIKQLVQWAQNVHIIITFTIYLNLNTNNVQMLIYTCVVLLPNVD
jgi:hypothetical protein